MGQKNNSEGNDLLSTYFRKRWEPLYAMSDAIGAHLMLPHLRGFWNYGPIDEFQNPLDVSGHGRTLNNANSVTYEVTPTLANVAVFDPASVQSLYHATEPGLELAFGFTLGGWFRFATIPGSGDQYALMSKRGEPGDYAWLLELRDDSLIWGNVSDDGTSESVGAGPYAVVIDQWYHIVFCFNPDVSPRIQTVWINGTPGIEVAAVPTSVFNSAAEFEIGAQKNGTISHLDGKSALNFICATVLPDHMIESLFWATQALFGVKLRG